MSSSMLLMFFMLASSGDGMRVSVERKMRDAGSEYLSDLDCFCRKGHCENDELGKDNNRALFWDDPPMERCCKKDNLDPTARSFRAPHAKDCTNNVWNAYIKWKEQVQGYEGWAKRNWPARTRDDCIEAIEAFEEGVREFARTRTWHDSPITGMNATWWAEDVLIGCFMQGKDRSHGKMFAVTPEKRKSPRALWAGEGSKEYAQTELGAVVMTSSAGEDMPVTQIIERSRIHKKCHSKDVKMLWKANSIGYVTKAKDDLPMAPMLIVFSKTFKKHEIEEYAVAERSVLWRYEIPALADNPPKGGIEVHNLSPQSCDEVMSKLRSHFQTQDRTLKTFLADMFVFSCTEVRNNTPETRSFYRTPFQEHCPRPFTTVNESLRCSWDYQQNDPVLKSFEDVARFLIVSFNHSHPSHLQLNLSNLEYDTSSQFNDAMTELASYLGYKNNTTPISNLTINLQGTNISAASAQKLVESLPSNLEEFRLDLSKTNISEKEAQDVLGVLMLSKPRIVELVLFDTFTNDGCSRLQSFLRFMRFTTQIFHIRCQHNPLFALKEIVKDTAVAVGQPLMSFASCLTALYGWMAWDGKVLSAAQNVSPYQWLVGAKRSLTASTAIVGTAAHLYYWGGKYLRDRDNAQTALMVSDLAEEIKGLDADKDIEEVAVALDFGVTNVAFNDAEQKIWDQLSAVLDKLTIPKSLDACNGRFDKALKPLRQAFCKISCRTADCDCRGTEFESLVDDPMKEAQGSACDGFFEWVDAGTATEQELQRFWPRYVDHARSVVRKWLADKFPSPALEAIAMEELLIDFTNKLDESCALNSSWLRPLGKAAHAIRQFRRDYRDLNTSSVAATVANATSKFFGKDREAMPRDIVAQKVDHVRNYVRGVTCPALKKAMCRAGCEDYQAYCKLSEVHQDASGYIVAVSYKDTYCKQTQEFASMIAPICGGDWSTFLATAKGLRPALRSTVGLLVTSMALYFVEADRGIIESNYPESLAHTTGGNFTDDLDSPPEVNGVDGNALGAFSHFSRTIAIQSFAHVIVQLVAGWKDGSHACQRIANRLLGVESGIVASSDIN